MENYGLITFRETAMLFDPGVSSINKKMTVASVVGHECAHQWFGNLVTPSCEFKNFFYKIILSNFNFKGGQCCF